VGYGLHYKMWVQSGLASGWKAFRFETVVWPFLVYWWKNLGLKFLLLPVIPFLLPRKLRLIFLTGVSLFILPNLVKFGADIWTNHKFFTLWTIFLNAGFAVVLTYLWCYRWFGKTLAIIFLIGLSASGWIDLFPIYNDSPYFVKDRGEDRIATYIDDNLSPYEIVATPHTLFSPVNLAGRAVVCGWPYFSWGAGFDTTERVKDMTELFSTRDPLNRCRLLKKYQANYLLVGKTSAINEPYRPDLEVLKSSLSIAAEDDRYFLFFPRKDCP
jgi:hypothetical protein